VRAAYSWSPDTILISPCRRGRLRYEVTGSKTGPDGTGEQNERFVSNSGRVVIEPKMWMVNWSLRYREAELPEGYEVTWRTLPLFVDTYEAPVTDDPAAEYATRLVQGLANSEHTLKLIPNGDGTDCVCQ
jgi:hypothetical protein